MKSGDSSEKFLTTVFDGETPVFSKDGATASPVIGDYLFAFSVVLHPELCLPFDTLKCSYGYSDGNEQIAVWVLNDPVDPDDPEIAELEEFFGTPVDIPVASRAFQYNYATGELISLDDLRDLRDSVADLKPAPTLWSQKCYGTFDLEALQKPLTYSFGRRVNDQKWKNKTETIGSFMDKLSVHVAGPKDGNAIVQGELVQTGKRVRSNIRNMQLLILDVDNGHSIKSVRNRIIKEGLMACIYSTHSHLKNVSDVSLDEVVKHHNKSVDRDDAIKSLEEVTDDIVLEYVRSEKGYEDHILKGAKVSDRAVTSEGRRVYVTHAPVEKFRVVFFLNEPFEFNDTKYLTLDDARQSWRKIYTGFCVKLGILHFDMKCRDTTRLFYMPRHPKGGEHTVEFIGGDLLDLSDIREVEERELLHLKDPFNTHDSDTVELSNPWLRSFAAKYSDSFEFADAYQNFAPDEWLDREGNDQWFRGVCPNYDRHNTKGGDLEDISFAARNASDSPHSSFGARCEHANCHQDRLKLLDVFVSELGLTEADLLAYTDEDKEIVEDKPGAMEDDEKEAFEEKLDALLEEVARKPKNIDTTKSAIRLIIDEVMNKTDQETYLASLTDITRMPKVRIKELVERFRKQKGESLGDSYPEATMKVLDAMNDRYALIPFGGSTKVYDTTLPVHEMIPHALPYRTFIDMMSNQTVMVYDENGNTVKKKAGQVWFEWPARRDYESLIFDPKGDSEDRGLYNTFKGFSCPKSGSDKDWATIKYHMLHIMCADNEEHFEYLMTWLAHIVQRPWEKPGAAVILLGGKGTGKSMFLRQLVQRRIVGGAYCFYTASPKQVFGGFNLQLANKLLVFLDEAHTHPLDRQTSGILKSLITEDELAVEGKGMNSVMQSNYLRICIASNEDHVVDATPDERRFFMVELSDEGRKEPGYFTKLQEEIEGVGATAFMKALSTWTVPNGLGWVEYLSAPPTTDLLRDQVTENMQPREDHLRTFLIEGRTNDLQDEMGSLPLVRLNDAVPTFLRTKDIIPWWELWCSKEHSYHSQKAAHPRGLAKAFKKLVGVEGSQMRAEDGAKHRGYLLPARADLIKILNAEKEYGNELVDDSEAEEQSNVIEIRDRKKQK